MISKRSLGCDLNDVAPRKRLRSNITDLFLSNTVSGARAASLLSDANAAGAAGVSDLSNLGGTQHVHRNLLAKCLRRSLWPRPYYFTCQVWNAHRGTEDTATLPILLPHEVLFAFRERAANVNKLLDTDGMDPVTRDLFFHGCKA